MCRKRKPPSVGISESGQDNVISENIVEGYDRGIVSTGLRVTIDRNVVRIGQREAPTWIAIAGLVAAIVGAAAGVIALF